MKSRIRTKEYLEKVRRSYVYQYLYKDSMKDAVRACEAIVGSQTATVSEIDQDLGAMETRLRANSATDEAAFVFGIRILFNGGRES